MESNGYPECAIGLYTYSDTYVSHDFTGATPLLLCEKHGNLLLTSYPADNVVPCVGKLTIKSLCIRVSFYSQNKFACTLSVLKEARNTTIMST